ncbi:MAG: hemerythrin [Pseudohongiellaceae bacterium]|jgi:hemerythrin
MEWKEAYATGVERIDEQHKSLFGMAADFGKALEEGAGELVSTLNPWLDGHICGIGVQLKDCVEN